MIDHELVTLLADEELDLDAAVGSGRHGGGATRRARSTGSDRHSPLRQVDQA